MRVLKLEIPKCYSAKKVDVRVKLIKVISLLKSYLAGDGACEKHRMHFYDSNGAV